MKKLLTLIAALLSSVSYAQSAFEGFYGQISTGYENNSYSNVGVDWYQVSNPANFGTSSASNQSSSGMPLVLGAGYFHRLKDKFLIGLGIDYSALSQKTSDFNWTAIPNIGAPMHVEKMSYEVSNRINISLIPAYAFDKDKLGYLKLGYSMAQLKYTQGAPEPSGITTGFSSSKNISGYILGLGYKQTIYKGFYGFAEGNYISYSKSTINGTMGAYGAPPDFRFSSNPSLTTYNFLVGVGYKF